MDATKRGPGRPPRTAERLRLPEAYGDEADARRVRALADRWRCSQAAAIRKAVMEAAKREKLC